MRPRDEQEVAGHERRPIADNEKLRRLHEDARGHGGFVAERTALGHLGERQSARPRAMRPRRRPLLDRPPPPAPRPGPRRPPRAMRPQTHPQMHPPPVRRPPPDPPPPPVRLAAPRLRPPRRTRRPGLSAWC